MALVALESITKDFGAVRILDGVTLDVHPGERVGLIGANGSGKSTLLKILAGELEADDGAVHIGKQVQLGYLPQIPNLAPGRTVRAAALEAFTDLSQLERQLRDLEEAMADPRDDAHLQRLIDKHGRLQEQFESAGGYAIEHRVDAALMGLGFGKADFEKAVETLSGGEKNRLALAVLLVTEPDCLLLDEPTNFLDLAATIWLEQFLCSASQAVVIVSHDRYLLDRVATRIVELERQHVTSYPGNYTASRAQKAERIESQRRAHANQAAFVEKEQAYIRKHIAGQRTRQAKGRRTRLARLERIDAPFGDAPPIRLGLEKDGRAGYTSLQVEGLRKAFGDRTLFHHLDLQLDRGERLGIAGHNGSGKSTFLGLLRGTVPADAGTVTFGHHVSPVFYDQEHGDLDPEASVIGNVQAVRPDAPIDSLRSFLGGFRFSGDDVFKPVSACSGGERSRVALARVVLSPTNLLILDEPTSHLDLATRGALEDALEAYTGTLIVVSHDRYFLDRVANRLLVFGEGDRGATHFDGTWTEWSDRRSAAPPPTAKAKRTPKSDVAPARPARAKRPLATIEQEIESCETAIADLHAEMGLEANYTDGERMRELQEQLDDRANALAALEAEWEAHG